MNMDRENKIKLAKRVTLVFAFLILLSLVIHYRSISHAPIPPAPTVIVTKPKAMNIAEYITQTGSTVAYNAVNLVARVEGYLDKISFVDGTFLKKGKPLFVIEPEPYMEKLLAAKASVAAQKAAFAYAKSEYARQKRMYSENATSLNNVEEWLAKSQETEAEVAKAIANAEIDAINYSYTHISAPFDGRIGRHLVDLGNLVGNGVATNLATIEQIDPLYVYFNPNELDLIKLRDAARAKGFQAKEVQQINMIKKIPVYVKMQNEHEFKHVGKLDFINTGLNASTGTMEFRAILPNKNYDLVPGLYVQVRIPISEPSVKLTVPDTAVLYDQVGPYLLLVDSNNKVLLQHVTIGELEQDHRAILTGLKKDDRVIIDGLQNATPGNPVSAQYEKTPK